MARAASKDETSVVRNDSCPKCGWWDVEGGSVDIEFGQATQNAHCTECGAEWITLYSLVKVTIMNEGEDG